MSRVQERYLLWGEAVLVQSPDPRATERRNRGVCFPGSPPPLSSFPFRHCASLEVKHLCSSDHRSGLWEEIRVMKALTSSLVSQFNGSLEDCRNVRRWNPTPEDIICPRSILSYTLLPSNLEPNSSAPLCASGHDTLSTSPQT